MNTVWRLAWALPLVLLVGTAAALVLRTFLIRTRDAGRERRRLSARESLALSEQTHVHLIEVDGALYLIVESERATVLQSALSQPRTAGHPSNRFAASWLRQLQKVEHR